MADFKRLRRPLGLPFPLSRRAPARDLLCGHQIGSDGTVRGKDTTLQVPTLLNK